MRFQDIPQFTQDGHYRVNVGLDYLKSHIERFKKEYGLIMDSDFQRGHVWTEDKQIAFMEFLLKGGRGSSEIRFNCPRWQRFSCGYPMVLVDGLQRVTAALRFINNEIPVFGYFYNQFEDKIPFFSGLEFLINDLETRSEVLQWYIDINTGGVVHTEEEIEKVRVLLEKEKGKENA